MRLLEDLDESLPFFKAMASDVRVKILKILSESHSMNLKDLAMKLDITNGALTSHIHILEEAGIIKTQTVAAKHGLQKICSVVEEKYLIPLGRFYEYHQNSYTLEIAPGQYIDYEIHPTCGLATSERIIGVYDTPRYFADTTHFQAQILWFVSGFVEYEIPNYLIENASFREIIFQAELGSEAPAFNNDYKSDIQFSINGIWIGTWQSSGDFGGERGRYNPSWWVPTMNQYGTLMEIRINKRGTFADGRKVSDVTIGQLRLTRESKIKLRLSVDPNKPNAGGLTIYGRGFGNFDSGMLLRIIYKPNASE
jgi:predicted transcriptional regulator